LTLTIGASYSQESPVFENIICFVEFTNLKENLFFLFLDLLDESQELAKLPRWYLKVLRRVSSTNILESTSKIWTQIT
jgi:hypothetical protein